MVAGVTEGCIGLLLGVVVESLLAKVVVVDITLFLTSFDDATSCEEFRIWGFCLKLFMSWKPIREDEDDEEEEEDDTELIVEKELDCNFLSCREFKVKFSSSGSSE